MATTISGEEFENAMTKLFAPYQDDACLEKNFADSDLDRVSHLLSLVGKVAWSNRPRTYAVLRLIDCVDAMDSFVLEDLFDIAFPYTKTRLPAALSSTLARQMFLEKQTFVLTKATDLEIQQGRHRHLAVDADAHFIRLRKLNTGPFADVDHVRSKLSLEEYARKRVYRRKMFARDKAAVKLFENELSNLKRLSHHHLVNYVGSYTDPKFIGLLISPVADCDLKVYLERSPFPKDDCIYLREFYGCLCSAVLYLHNQKCRHKDLKPGNVLVKGNTILITDFGTARDWSEKGESTTTGPIGPYTPGYAPSEVMSGDSRNMSSDMWSLGCIFLDMTTVLKGETLVSKRLFLENNGSGGLNPRTNPLAVETWLQQLQAIEVDRQPVEWIRLLLLDSPASRITASNLFDQISQFQDDHVYYGACCNGYDDSDDESSYHGSNSEFANDDNDFDHDSDRTVTTTPKLHTLMRDSVLSSVTTSRPIENKVDEVVHQEDAVECAKIIAKPEIFETPEVLKLLQQLGFDISQIESQLKLRRFMRTAVRHLKVVKWIIGQRIPLELRDENGMTLLLHATQFVRENVVLLLVESGANVDATCSVGWTPIHHASKQGNLRIVKLLADRKTSINLKTYDGGYTPLHVAARAGEEAVIRELVDNGADVDAWDFIMHTALHYAAKFGSKAVVRALLQKGADVEAKDGVTQNTALHFAAQRGHVDVIILLIDAGADVTELGRLGPTAFHYVAMSGSISAAEIFLEKGVGVDNMNAKGETALQYAAKKGDLDMIRFLIKAGANIEAEDKTQLRPLHLAAMRGGEAAVRLLLQNKAQIEAKDCDGSTALHWAIKYRSRSTTSALISERADINAVDREDDTPLHLAVLLGFENLVKLLLASGAKRNLKDFKGNTAEDLASEAGRAKIKTIFDDARRGDVPRKPIKLRNDAKYIKSPFERYLKGSP